MFFIMSNIWQIIMEIDFYIVLITFIQEERCELIGTVNNSAEMKAIIEKVTLL